MHHSRISTRPIRLLALLIVLAGFLRAQSDPNRPAIVLQTGHRFHMKDVAVSPDGSWIATGSLDSTLKIWDTETAQERRSINTGPGGVSAIALAPNGKTLVTAGSGSILRSWNVESGAEGRRYEGLSGVIEAITFSADGRLIAAGGFDKKVWLFDAATGEMKAPLDRHTGPVYALAFSPDGSTLASAGADSVIRIWNISTGKQVQELKDHKEVVRILRFDPTGTLLASGGDDKTVRLWRMPKGDDGKPIVNHSGPVAGLEFTRKGLLSADLTGEIRTFDTTTRKETASIKTTHQVDIGKIVFARDRGVAVFAYQDGTGVVTDVATGARLGSLQAQTVRAYGTAFTSDRRLMAVGAFDGTIKLWNLYTGMALPSLRGHAASVRSVAFHQDDRRLVSAASDGTVRVWDTAGLMPTSFLEGHSGHVTKVVTGSKTGIVVTAGADGKVGIFDLDRPSPGRLLPGHTGEVVSVAISVDESMIASAGADGTVRLWETATGNPIRTISPPNAGSLDAVAISPDGKLIAVGGIDKTIRIYGVDGTGPINTLSGHTGEIYSVSFRADGKQLVSAAFDTTVRLWNVENGRPAGVLSEHAGAVYSANFLPDQRLIVSASEDGSVIFWDAETQTRRLSVLSIRGDADDWLVATPEGFFDGTQPAFQQILWRFDNNTFNVRPAEEFFNEFLLPGLLTELINGRKLPPGTDISRKNRIQPLVKISLPDVRPRTAVSERMVKVRIDITSAPNGAKDVRLFRNGALTYRWSGDQVVGRPLEATVPIVAGENRFTAFAYNSDEIKSRDDTVVVTGAESLRRKGVMYVLAIGINNYANEDYKLGYAVKDATEFADEFIQQQRRIGTYETFEVLPLLDEKATKKGILGAIAGLADKVEPEDALVVFYSGHGVAEQKRFYLIAHDIAYRGRRSEVTAANFDQVIANGVSDLDLEKSVVGVRAEQFLLVIDACNSGQAIESEEARRGPMNSKGLAQLAWEKGMYILTASQSFQDAKEYSRLGNGYLTYALVQDGIRTLAADRPPKDGQIKLREWLDYAVDRVPQIDRQFQRGGRETTKGFERPKPKPGQQAGDLQQPRVFYRREREVREMIVAMTR